MKKVNCFKMFVFATGFFLMGCNQGASENRTEKKEVSVSLLDELAKDQATDNQSLDDSEVQSIKKIIALFKEPDIDKIADIISYPLQRNYPISPIKNKEEFKVRFHEVFDKKLMAKIAESDVKQWSKVGWRGIMLDEGVVWMANSDGIITAVNHESEEEEKLRKDLIKKQKENLHSSLKSFESPTYQIRTKNYLIRIDELTNKKYRYASWKTGMESSEPDIILENGELEFQGSGGNHVITFGQGDYTYNVYRNIIGESNTADVTLEIEKDGKVILTEYGRLIFE